MKARIIYNGNDIDRSIPFTREAYTHITDEDYRPLPGENVMDIDRAVETSRAADVDAATVPDVSEFVYAVKDFALDAGDIMLPENDHDVTLIMQSLRNALFYDELMLPDKIHNIEYTQTLLDYCATIGLACMRAAKANGYTYRNFKRPSHGE